MALQIKKRGRPSKAMLAARNAANVKPKRTDAEVLQDLKDRFDMLGKLTRAAMGANMRALVVSGSAGVGKTYTIESILGSTPNAKYDIVRGALSAVNLYKLGYKYRHEGNVIVLDDADSIFTDEDALNVLKALCDSSAIRTVSWMKESAALREDNVDTRYDFHGSFIFVSNIDFQNVIDMGHNKYAVHMEALMSRSLYLDLKMHDRQAVALWISHVATVGKMFSREGISDAVGAKILAFIHKYRDDMRELSLRTAMKLCQLYKTNPQDWERMGRVLLLK